MTTLSPLRRSAVLGFALLAVVSAGACSDASDGTAEGTSSVATTVATTPTTGAPGTTRPPDPAVPSTAGTAPPGAAGVRDWDGARFDIGALNRIDRTEAGGTKLVGSSWGRGASGASGCPSAP